MNPALYATFCLAVIVLAVIPGPIVTLVIANSLRNGTRTGLATVAGTASGSAVLVAAGAVGLTTLLTLLSSVFDIVRWIGAGYLIWLGILAWRSHAGVADPAALNAGPRSARAVFLQGFMIAVTNPKTILFYIAFFPQFIDRTLPAAPQLAVMSVTMVVIAALSDCCYALLAGRARGWFTAPARRRLQARITGSLLIGTGFGLLLARRGG